MAGAAIPSQVASIINSYFGGDAGLEPSQFGGACQEPPINQPSSVGMIVSRYIVSSNSLTTGCGFESPYHIAARESLVPSCTIRSNAKPLPEIWDAVRFSPMLN